MENLTKLTLKGMGCNPMRAAADKKKVPMAQIIGIATRTYAKEDANGQEHWPIVGQFEGINLETGEVFQSALLYLPGGLHEQISEPLRTAGKEAKIQFGIIVNAIPSSAPIGYGYSAEPLIAADQADPLQALRDASAAKRQAMLEAPKAGASHAKDTKAA